MDKDYFKRKSDESYDQLVMRYEKTKNDRKYIHIEKGSSNLVISMTTFNNKERYQSLVTLSNSDFDSLFITNSTNSYYLEEDLSFSFYSFLKPFIEKYGPENVIFFGSSMAGFGAIRFAVNFGANAITSNAQVCFEKTKKLCWPNLLTSINNIPNIQSISEMKPSQNVFIYFAYGKHPMDYANYESMVTFTQINKEKVYTEFFQYDTFDHIYLFQDIKIFLGLIKQIFEKRKKIFNNNNYYLSK